MKIRFSISLKLLLLILPLVCLPIGIVGYFSFHAAVERVDRLVRHEQMVTVRMTADKIRDIFTKCRMDLETISGLPVMEDFHNARTFRLRAETEFNHEKIVKLFQEFLNRTTAYYQIRYIDHHGEELVVVNRHDMDGERKNIAGSSLFLSARKRGRDRDHFSDIQPIEGRDIYVIHRAKAVFSAWNEFAGVLCIDLDYTKIIRIVEEIQVGENGYAFMVDNQGRTTAHPRYEPYAHDLETLPEPSLAKLVRQMITGASAWEMYSFEGEQKMAAFAPVLPLGWSIAATIPTTELKAEARAIQTRVIQVVVITLLFAVIGVSLISYLLRRPVRNLVAATHRIAAGDLSRQIPVQTSDELGDLTHSFNRMTQNLATVQDELIRSEKLISLGRLSAGVAHEIRNPLNAMKGAIVLMQRRRKADPLIQEYTHLVMEEIDRLNNFVTDFLYFARQSRPKPVPTDVNALILTAQKLFAEQASNRDIRFHNHLASNLPKITIDPHQMEQVILNLLVNAMDALPDGGNISFSTFYLRSKPEDDGSGNIRIEIRDNGIGIPKANLQDIFDPFFSTKESGTGIGLPLSLGIVDNHGGRLNIKPRENRGTKVILELPVPGVKSHIDTEEN
ncbi:MAG: HAMP domain-containing protein [Desulfobacteraceae bacterium]|nr:HAMP domain-containing protein [Desulfobacteraceae bacterium]